MEIIYISNGLGNQMSAYALYLRKLHAGSKATYACKDKLHNGVELDKVFGIRVRRGLLNFIYLVIGHIMMVPLPNLVVMMLRWCLSKMGVSCYMENYHYEYHTEAVECSKSNLFLLAGGWHHYKYLDGIEKDVRKAFRFKPFTREENKKIAEEADKKNAVAIHIRRGDYLKGDNFRKYGSVCDVNYYRNAISVMEETVDNPIYYVFSNDMEWSRQLLEGKDIVCVDWNKGTSSWEDMALMSKFRNIIIANSTFSWWAAWLGDHEKNVVCPSVLMAGDEKSDIYPEEWHHIVMN